MNVPRKKLSARVPPVSPLPRSDSLAALVAPTAGAARFEGQRRNREWPISGSTQWRILPVESLSSSASNPIEPSEQGDPAFTSQEDLDVLWDPSTARSSDPD